MKKLNILFCALTSCCLFTVSCDKNDDDPSPSSGNNDSTLRRNPTVDIKAKTKRFEGKYYHYKDGTSDIDSNDWIALSIVDTNMKLLNTGRYANIITDSFDCTLSLRLVKNKADSATIQVHGVWQDDGSNIGAKVTTNDGLFLNLSRGMITGVERDDIKLSKNLQSYNIFGSSWFIKYNK